MSTSSRPDLEQAVGELSQTVGELTRTVGELTRTVIEIKTRQDMASRVGGALAAAILSGVVWVLVSVTTLSARVDELTRGLAKVERRLDAIENMEGPLGRQFQRLQDQFDVLQKQINERPAVSKSGP